MVNERTCHQLVTHCQNLKKLVFVGVCEGLKYHKDTLQISKALVLTTTRVTRIYLGSPNSGYIQSPQYLRASTNHTLGYNEYSHLSRYNEYSHLSRLQRVFSPL